MCNKCTRENMNRKAWKMKEIKPVAFEMLANGISPADVSRQLDVHRTTIVRWMKSGAYSEFLVKRESEVKISTEEPAAAVPIHGIKVDSHRKAEFMKALRATGRTDVAALYVSATPEDIYKWTVTEASGLRAKSETYLKIAALCWEIAHSDDAKPADRLRAVEMVLKNSDWRSDAPAVSIEIQRAETNDGRTPVQIMLEGMRSELERFEGVDLLNVVDVEAAQ